MQAPYKAGLVFIALVSVYLFGSNWEIVRYPVLACFIAILVPTGELLTKYRALELRQVFYCPYFFCLLLVNIVFCCLVYYSLPKLKSILATEPDWLKVECYRAIVAGFLYPVIARSSLFDLRIKEETYGVGFDMVYKGIANFLSHKHRNRVNSEMRDNFNSVYNRNRAEVQPIIFYQAADSLCNSGLPSDKEITKKARDALNSIVRDCNEPDDLCYTLYFFIRDHSANRSKAEETIKNFGALPENSERWGQIRKLLPHIYPKIKKKNG